jgi:hypothetical protein
MENNVISFFSITKDIDDKNTLDFSNPSKIYN